MENTFTARVNLDIKAPVEEVWKALVDPDIIRQYLHGTNAISDWREGSSLEFKGNWKGKEYHDKGTILKMEPLKLFRYSWLSSLSELEDNPKNYSVITYQLNPVDGGTELRLTQENIATEDGKKSSEKNWSAVLEEMKSLLEE